MRLLNPGPVRLSERVRRSMLQVDLCHREPEFFDLQDEARRRLLGVYESPAAHWSAVLLSASGTAAVESMLAALVPRDGRVLIAENGVYGERMAQICGQYGIAHERCIGDWLLPLDVAALERILRAPGAGFTHLAAVHHETTTGRLNDLPALSELCRRHGLGLLLDAVSSFGAEAIDFNEASLHAVAATANKCLHGAPGVAFVVARRALLASCVSRTYYLDLARLAKLQEVRSTPFTPAVHAMYALVEALREHAELGGRAARYARYAQLAEQVRAGLRGLGIEALVPAAQSSVVLRAYRLPDEISYPKLHDALKADGFVIYAGQGNLADILFRIATMGELASADIAQLLDCFARLRA